MRNPTPSDAFVNAVLCILLMAVALVTFGPFLSGCSGIGTSPSVADAMPLDGQQRDRIECETRADASPNPGQEYDSCMEELGY